MQPAPMVPCGKCGTPIAYGSPQCPNCGQRFVMVAPGQPQQLGDDATMRALLPVGRTALSIIAGYVGIVTLLFFPVGPISLLLGILAAREIKAKPGTHGMGRAVFAIVMGVLGTGILLAIALVAIFKK